MAPRRYVRELLSRAVAEATSWADLMRRLDMKDTGGQRRVLREKVDGFGLDTSHFTPRNPKRKYSDEAIATAVAGSTSLREVVLSLGAEPANGTLSHIARRIEAAGIDTGHFSTNAFFHLDTPIDARELARAAATSDSVRTVAQALGLPDDVRARASVRNLLKKHGVDTSHFRNSQVAVHERALRAAVPTAHSYADVMRTLGMEVTDVNHQRVRRAVARLGLDTSHFVRRAWGAAPTAGRPSATLNVLAVHPPGTTRVNRARLHSALQKLDVPYLCVFCGNDGEWLGRRVTLHIDHISGDWRDNRPENLRYLCPNCHALTDTWCRSGRSKPLVVAPENAVH